MPEVMDPKKRIAEMRALLLRSEKTIVKRFPGGVNASRMFTLYLDYVRLSPSVQECHPQSVLGAVIQAAALGLSLDTVFGEAYLVPRWSKRLGQKVAQFQTGYKGLRKLALQADPELRDIYARVVREHDVFEYSYEPPGISFRPGAAAARGALRYAYARALWKDRYDRFVVLDGHDIQRIKEASDAYRSGKRDKQKQDSPWFQWEEAMWEKSAIRQLCGTLTLSVEAPLAQAFKQEEIGGDEAIIAEGVEIVAPEGGGEREEPAASAPTEAAAPASALDQVVEQAERAAPVAQASGAEGQQSLLGDEAPQKKRR
jgi:recombination protein RecT